MILALGCLLGGSVFIAPAPVRATTTFIVDTNADTIVGGACSLRGAIAAINTGAAQGSCPAGGAAGDSITFAPAVTGTITLGGSQLTLSKSMTITGPGAAVLAVDANNASRVLQVDNGTTVTISGLTIQHGHLTNANGGGILNNGTLTVTDSVIQNNQVVGVGSLYSHGGGVAGAGSNLILARDLFSGNSAGTNGGGVSWESGGTITITNSTVTGNHAGIDGGGVFGQNLVLIADTITSNSADNLGGGVFRSSSNGPVSVGGSIIAGNTASHGPDYQGSEGGGTRPTTDLGYNLIGDNSMQFDPTPFPQVNTMHDIVGTGGSPVNAMLATLGNYGGRTPTRPPVTGSPAIDAGGNPCITDPTTTMPLATDQRGVTRPQGTACDIGAVERGASVLQATGGDRQQTDVTLAFPATLAAAVTNTDGSPPVGSVTFTITPGSGGASATFAGGGTSAMATITSGTATSPTLTANGTPGHFTVTATFTGGSVTFTLLTAPLPHIMTTMLPGGAAGTMYSQTITTTGGTAPLTFSHTGTLPPGLGLSTAGILSGAPTTVGTFMFSANVTDTFSQMATQAYTVTITPLLTTLGPSSGDLHGGSRVAINGAGFGTNPSNVQVTIGGTAATVGSVSDTMLVVTAPPGAAGAADVVVTVNSISSTKTGGYTYGVVHATPAPEETAVPMGMPGVNAPMHAAATTVVPTPLPQPMRHA